MAMVQDEIGDKGFLRRNEHEIGEPAKIIALEGSKTTKAFSKFFGFLEVQVRTLDKDRLPLHAVKKNGKLLFPIVENWTTTWLFSEEMRRGLELEQYEYKIVSRPYELLYAVPNRR